MLEFEIINNELIADELLLASDIVTTVSGAGCFGIFCSCSCSEGIQAISH